MIDTFEHITYGHIFNSHIFDEPSFLDDALFGSIYAELEIHGNLNRFVLIPLGRCQGERYICGLEIVRLLVMTPCLRISSISLRKPIKSDTRTRFAGSSRGIGYESVFKIRSICEAEME